MNSERFTHFNALLKIISQRSPLQMKRILKYLSGRDAIFWQRADKFARNLSMHTSKTGMGLKKEDVVEAYLKMCGDMFVEKIKFQETGAYSCSSAKKAYESVYSSEQVMTPYMYGLALSYFLWPNHYAIYDFFIHEIKTVKSNVNRYLEVGAGHGLFLSGALDAFPGADFAVVDISQACIAITQRFVQRLSGRSRKIVFHRSDIMSFDPAATFSMICMGEVLEHVDHPEELLIKVQDLLEPHGTLFISTCCNSPAIDHIHLFRNIRQVRDLFKKTGFRIRKELALPVDTSRNQVDDYDEIELNYAAVLE